jgi:methionyl-tRNA formyltransferase
MINKKDGMTDFTGSAEEIERMIRAYLDWPTCYSYLEGLQIKFFRAEALMDQQPDGEPGTISETGKDFYIINCGEGKLKVYEQQLQGKKRMNAGDFMRGHKLSAGDIFGSEEV